MAIVPVPIKSLSDFISVTSNIGDKKKLWFRGTPDADYTLQPSIFRDPFNSTMEIDFKTQFQSRSIPYLKHIPNKEWEWQFVMQHFGVPTRLLDWTSSGLAALAFAILFREDKQPNDRHFGKNAAIWCLDPIKLNVLTRLALTNPDKIPDISNDKQIDALYAFNSTIPEYPVAITGPLNNERIVAQKGVFTLFPNSSPFSSLETKDKAEEFLTKIFIDANDIPAIRKELIRMGMSECSLFPDLTYLAMELKRELTEHV